MSDSTRSNTRSSISVEAVVNGLNSNLNLCSNEEIEDTINNLHDVVKVKLAESERLQTTLENIKRKNADLAADNRELKLRIESINNQIELREELNESLRLQLKYMKESHTRMTAFENKSFDELVSEFASQLALNHLANRRRRSQEAHQQQPQLAMLPSTSNQPSTEQLGPNFLDFNRKN